MKVLRKFFCWITCTVALLIIVLYGLRTTTVLPLRFGISSDNSAEEISIYEAEDGNCYVFLPSYAELEELTVLMSSDQQVSLGGVKLSNGMTCEEFVLETAYPFEINGRHKANLWFYQSANVATMYIDTVTGNMEYIHADKENEERSSITLYTANGILNYQNGTVNIHGRGNSTWLDPKKPYSLALPGDADLLGMGAASNWILLANAYDQSNLHNKLIFDFANQTGMEWSPECEYVDVYLNGAYNGLYLLSEKVEAGDQRLNINTNAGDFLCTLDFENRWDSLRNPFQTHSRRTVEIIEPKVVTNDQFSSIQMQVNQFEHIIMNTQDVTLAQKIDIDSWARRYLVDEIFCSIDADLSSSYFYSNDGIIYAGPIWDYDTTFGKMNINKNPWAFYAKMPKKYANYSSTYYSSLYSYEVFYNRVTQIYQDEFLPLLEKMIESDIPRISALITEATQMNNLRWGHNSTFNITDSSDIINYLSQRIDFLNSAWIDGVEYCTIQFNSERWTDLLSVSVKHGCLLETSYVDIENTAWIVETTGAFFDSKQPITEDMRLIPYIEENASTEYSLVTRDYISFLSIAILLFLLGLFILIDIFHRQKERRPADERRKTKISP